LVLAISFVVSFLSFALPSKLFSHLLEATNWSVLVSNYAIRVILIFLLIDSLALAIAVIWVLTFCPSFVSKAAMFSVVKSFVLEYHSNTSRCSFKHFKVTYYTSNYLEFRLYFNLTYLNLDFWFFGLWSLKNCKALNQMLAHLLIWARRFGLRYLLS